MQPRQVIVVAATRAEAAFVPSGLQVVVTGLGKTAAAVATTEALGRLASSRVVVVNIGTAGALHDHIDGIYEPGVVLNHDINAEAIRALGYDPQERLTLVGDPNVVLATGDVFVFDPAVRSALARRAHLVDMEGYAVAYAARRAEVAVRVVKHVSDRADETALEWPDRVAASAAALGAWLEENVDALLEDAGAQARW